MEEENILETIIDLANYRVDFNIKTDFIAEGFSDDRLERMLKLSKPSKNVYCLNVLIKTK